MGYRPDQRVSVDGADVVLVEPSTTINAGDTHLTEAGVGDRPLDVGLDPKGASQGWSRIS